MKLIGILIALQICYLQSRYKSTLSLEKRGEACMCKHWECPYRYCPYHKNFSQELLDSAREVIPNTVKSVIPDIEWGQTPENCQSYLDR